MVCHQILRTDTGTGPWLQPLSHGKKGREEVSGQPCLLCFIFGSYGLAADMISRRILFPPVRAETKCSKLGDREVNDLMSGVLGIYRLPINCFHSSVLAVTVRLHLTRFCLSAAEEVQ